MSNDERDPLEQNLERLLPLDPGRERLGAEASARIAAALEAGIDAAESAVPKMQRRPPAPRLRLLPLAAGALALAAAVALMVMGPWTDPTVEGPGDTRTGGGGSASGPGAPGPGDMPGAPGERTPAGTPKDADGGGEDEPEALAVASDRDSDSDPDRDLVASVRIEGGVRPAPGAQVVVWTRPVLELPRVADAQRVEAPFAADQDATEVVLGEAKDRARAAGAERILVRASIEPLGTVSTVVELSEAGPLELVIGGGGRVLGVVIDGATGAPVEGALAFPVRNMPLDMVPVDQAPSERFPRPWAVTDSSGAFTMDGVAPGATLRVSRVGYAPAWVLARPTGSRIPLPHAELPVALLEVQASLEPGGAVEGVVEGPDGTRLGGAVIVASKQEDASSEGSRGPLTFGRAIADDGGRYAIGDLAPGPHVILVFGPEGGTSAPPLAFRSVGIAQGQTATVNFLGPGAGQGASLTGVVRGPDGTAIAGLALALAPTDGEGAENAEPDWVAATTDSEGRFSFPDLEPGSWGMVIGRDDFRHLTTLWEGEVDGPVRADLRLDRGAVIPRIEGEEAGGRPAVWLLLERAPAAGGSGWTFAGSALELGRGPLPRLFNGLPAGRYRLTAVPVGSDSLAHGFPEPFEFSPERDEEVRVVMAPGRAVQLRLVDGAGAPRSGAALSSIALVTPQGPRTLPTRTPPVAGADGVLTQIGLPLGPLTLEIRGTGGKRIRVAVPRGPLTAPVDVPMND